MFEQGVDFWQFLIGPIGMIVATAAISELFKYSIAYIWAQIMHIKTSLEIIPRWVKLLVPFVAAVLAVLAWQNGSEITGTFWQQVLVAGFASSWVYSALSKSIDKISSKFFS